MLEHHQALIDASAIEPEIAAGRGYRSVTKKAELEALGFALAQRIVPALVIPVHDVNGNVAMHQIRPDRPRVVREKSLKYETPKGARMVVDVPPAVRAHLGDPSVDLWVTEGARKADAAVSAGLCCVALLGVWNWRGTNGRGGKLTLSCWDSIALNDRRVLIAFDSDVTTKPEVAKAVQRLKAVLEQRGARVRVVQLPSGPNGEKVGLDDYLAAHGRESLLQLVNNSSAAAALMKSIINAKKITADLLVEIAEPAELFHTTENTPYATVPVGTHFETHEISGRGFKRWLSARFWEEYERTAAPDALRQAVTALEGRALFTGQRDEVHVRLARARGALYLYLADADWRAVQVDADGWRIVARPPVRFRRAAGMLEIPAPEPGGNLADLAKFVNVADSNDFKLLVGWLVGALRYLGPFLILVLLGEQGSGKTLLGRILRALIDPNQAALRAQPRDPRDVAIAANNAWLIALDNLSGVADWLSDTLCRLSTGGGFGTRLLYTNNEEAIFDAQRPIILNGIDSVGSRGDLLDRAIILNLPRIDKYRPEAELWSEFEAARPKLLGALLDAVSIAMRRESEIQLERSVRMADAARWVVAAEPALPWKPGAFLNAYAANRADSHQIAIESSLVAASLMKMKFTDNTWSGTAADLLDALEQVVGEKVASSKRWPKSARGLAGELRRLAPNLRAVGIEIDFTREPHTGRRTVTIVTTATQAVAGPENPRGYTNGGVTVGDGRVTVGHVDRHPETAREHGPGDAGDGGDGLSQPSASSWDFDL